MHEFIESVTEENFEDRVINRSKMFPYKLYVMKLWLDTCAPCKAMAPTYDRIATKMQNEFKPIEFFDANLEEAPIIASTYGIQSVPTILFIKNSEEVGNLVGLKNEKQISDKINELINEGED
jgi:thioredoxin 1